jgi:NADH-quinone oxidoreductase subunit J
MIGPALFFYLFAGVCVASAVMVVTSRNPVHSVLFLILAFVNAAGLFMLLGAEFLAMILWSFTSARSRCCSCSSS